MGAGIVKTVRGEDIYEGLFDEAAFARLPALLADAVGAQCSVIQWRRRDGDFEVAGHSGFAAAAVRSYGEAWRARDPWAAAALSPQWVNQLVLLEEAVPRHAFAKTAFYNEFCRPEASDASHCMGAGFTTPWGDGLFGLLRRCSEPAFSQEDLERFRPYARMAHQVLNLKGELAAARRRDALARTSLDVLGQAIVAVDNLGRLISANEAAEIVLRRADGLVARAGRVSASLPADASSLRSAVARATVAAGPTARALQISRGPEKSPYLVTVSPMSAATPRRRAILLFSDPDALDASLTDRLRLLFGLSRAEASIAVELGKARSPSEIAADRSVQTNTVYVQVKSIMAKMGCSRQAEVAAAVAGLPLLRTG